MKNSFKIKLLSTLLIATTVASAQHEVGFSMGVGPSTLKYEDSKMINGNILGPIGIEYNYHFVPSWSLGFGVEYNLFQSKVQMDENCASVQTIAPEGLPVGSIFLVESDVKSLRETQCAGYLKIPIVFQYQTNGKQKFYARAGMKLGIPIIAEYESSVQSMCRRGYSAYTGQYYENMPSHGFASVNGSTSDGDLNLKLSYIGTAEIGAKWSLSSDVNLYTGVYLDYGFNDIRKDKAEGEMVSYNYDNKSLNACGSVLQSQNGGKAMVDKVSTLGFGLKVRLTVNAHKKTKEISEEVLN